MSKKDYAGWKDVFQFSFEQGIKAKSYYVSLIIFSLLILLALPVMSLMQNREKPLGDTQITSISIYDETELGINYANALPDSRYASLQIKENNGGSYEDCVKALENPDNAGDVALRIKQDEYNTFQLTFVKSASNSFSSKDYDAMVEDFVAFFEDAKREAIEVTPEQAAFIAREVTASVEFASVDENGSMSIAPKERAEGVSLEEYTILLAAIVVVMMIINLSGAQIANGIVTEKSTRVVEYLMINVRPMALIVGKILASLLMVVIQFAAMGVAYVLGKGISNSLFGAAEASENASSVTVFLDMLSQITADKLILSIIVILLGVLFFCIIAGLAGASVSKVDELSEGMKLYQIMLVAGSYIGIGMCIMEMTGRVDPAILNAVSMIPISAPFVLPANLLLGKIAMGPAIIGTVLLLVLTVVLFVFTAKVYESMIFYNGTVLKFKDILQIAKNRSAEKKEVK